MSARWAKRTDSNEKTIVNKLRQLPGVHVITGHDDIIVGYNMQNYWFEVKTKETLSKKTGKVKTSSIRPSQKKLKREWTGQYNVVTSFEEIIDIIGYGRRKLCTETS